MSSPRRREELSSELIKKLIVRTNDRVLCVKTAAMAALRSLQDKDNYANDVVTARFMELANDESA